jgi:hypothetical protein
LTLPEKNKERKEMKHWCIYYNCPVVFEDFDIIPIEAVRGQILGGMEAGGQGESPVM